MGMAIAPATATLRAVGGSVAVVIPRAWLALFGFEAGGKVELRADDGVITLQAVRKRPKYTLAQLLEGLAPDEQLPLDRDWENAPPVGLEVL